MQSHDIDRDDVTMQVDDPDRFTSLYVQAFKTSLLQLPLIMISFKLSTGHVDAITTSKHGIAL